MLDAFIGNWTQQSHVSPTQLTSISGLNSRFLDLAGGGLLAPGLALKLAGLLPLQRAAAANCPYALFDLRFGDELYWRERPRAAGNWRVAAEPNGNATNPR